MSESEQGRNRNQTRRQYFESLTDEFSALRDRVRSLISGAHWQTDGEWKESVLRSCLRRYLPTSFSVGKGFVVTPEVQTRQLDIVVYDNSKPLLFRDGDLVILTPDAVRVVIEVKTRVRGSELAEILECIGDNAEVVRRHGGFRSSFCLFSYECDSRCSNRLLDALYAGAHQKGNRRVDLASLGRSIFTKHHEFHPEGEHRRMYTSWHQYHLSKMAPGYFISNVIEAVCPESVYRYSGLWYPSSGKESHVVGRKSLKDITGE